MKTKKQKKQNRLFMLFFMLGIFCLMAGLTYAFYTYSQVGSKENVISTGNMYFLYDEQKGTGNGINITNAFPISDEAGKLLAGADNTFEFQVLANATGANITYDVVIEKESSSTFNETMIKIYLATLNGEVETEVGTTLNGVDVRTYNELIETNIKDRNGKTIYTDTVVKGISNYSKNFRLRMWVAEDVAWEESYNNKNFSVKVNVFANPERD